MRVKKQWLEPYIEQTGSKLGKGNDKAVYHHPVYLTSMPSSVQLLSHVWHWDPMDCIIQGFPVLHEHPELAQIHVNQVSDAIQPFILCHPLLLLLSFFPSIRVFSNESVLHIRWPTLQHQYQSFQWMNIEDWFPLELTGGISLKSKDSQESSPTPQLKSINYLVLSFLYGPILTFILEY